MGRDENEFSVLIISIWSDKCKQRKSMGFPTLFENRTAGGSLSNVISALASTACYLLANDSQIHNLIPPLYWRCRSLEWPTHAPAISEMELLSISLEAAPLAGLGTSGVDILTPETWEPS